MAESNFIAMSRGLLDELGSLDPGFESPGGGMANMKFYRRICDCEDATLVCLFGEATFHQLHGLKPSAKPQDFTPYDKSDLRREYKQVRGKD